MKRTSNRDVFVFRAQNEIEYINGILLSHCARNIRDDCFRELPHSQSAKTESQFWRYLEELVLPSRGFQAMENEYIERNREMNCGTCCAAGYKS